ncbi:MAG: barstar family protein [Oscillospiraceae bacterium]|nr:barstar family protein [Oscillospiraceae bacterium]
MTEHIIDFSTVESARDFHQVLAQTLGFPEWYGHNLDALYDCLTELEAPVRLVLEHWDAAVPFAEGFCGVFQDVQAEYPDFAVIFA